MPPGEPRLAATALQTEWPGVFEAAGKAEAAVHADPLTDCGRVETMGQRKL